MAFDWDHDCLAYQIVTDAIIYIMAQKKLIVKCLQFGDYVCFILVIMCGAGQYFEQLSCLLDELGLPMNPMYVSLCAGILYLYSLQCI